MNLNLIMVLILAVTGAVWLFDKYWARARRGADKEPWWIETSKSVFPVFLAVFVLRSFLAEPFKIPSGSMVPTLQIGDFIFVNKFTYGIRIPLLDIKLVKMNDPQRGDVMVFRYPVDPSKDFIKRVVGVPGDTITYRDKRIFVNGNPVKLESEGNYKYLESGLEMQTLERYQETLGTKKHAILLNPEMPNARLEAVQPFPHRDNCTYSEHEFTCLVPPGNYFMMGDNRDNSSDGRYWGFVPDRNIVGKAFMIWWNFSDLKRIGTMID